MLFHFSIPVFQTLPRAVQIDGREEKEYPDKRPIRWEDWGGEDRGWGRGCAMSLPEHPALFWAFDTNETWRLCPQRLRVAGVGGGGLGSVRQRKRKGRSESIMHQIRKIHNLSLQQARNLHLTEPRPHKKTKNITRGGANCQSPSSSQWAKLICKYIPEIKRLNYTGKWGSYTWIVRIMNNYCELPAPNITAFFYIYI